jgi:hypothetical protein
LDTQKSLGSDDNRRGKRNLLVSRALVSDHSLKARHPVAIVLNLVANTLDLATTVVYILEDDRTQAYYFGQTGLDTDDNGPVERGANHKAHKRNSDRMLAVELAHILG